MDTLYINLSCRPDRNKHVLEQLESIGHKGIRIEAVECKYGAIGCGMSHIRCLEMAKELIAAGADVNGVDSCGRTELYYAIKDGRLEIAEYLKQNGAIE